MKSTIKREQKQTRLGLPNGNSPGDEETAARITFGMRRSIGAVALALCVALLAGCSQDGNLGPDGGEPVAAGFTASVEGSGGIAKTRTENGGDRWVYGDQVGIFMLTAGGTMPGDIISGADNRKYTVDNVLAGALVPANSSSEIYYPQSGSVDFAAYYPYGTVGTDYKYDISVIAQNDPAAIDVLYAKNPNVTKSTVAVNLSFDHVLSKVTLNVNAGNGLQAGDISGLAASAVTFGGMPVTAALALQDGALTAGGTTGTFNPMKAASTGYHATFTAILVPQAANAYASRTVMFTVGGDSYVWTIPDAHDFDAGNHYTYQVTVNKSGVTVGAATITKWNERNNGAGTAEFI